MPANGIEGFRVSNVAESGNRCLPQAPVAALQDQKQWVDGLPIFELAKGPSGRASYLDVFFIQMSDQRFSSPLIVQHYEAAYCLLTYVGVSTLQYLEKRLQR